MTIDDLMCAIGTPLALVLFWLCVLNKEWRLGYSRVAHSIPV